MPKKRSTRPSARAQSLSKQLAGARSQRDRLRQQLAATEGTVGQLEDALLVENRFGEQVAAYAQAQGVDEDTARGELLKRQREAREAEAAETDCMKMSPQAWAEHKRRLGIAS